MDKIKVLLADDHGIFRLGVCLFLESQPDIEVIGEAEDGPEAIRLVLELSPDLALVNVSMKNSAGFEVIREIRRLGARTTVVALTMHDGDDQIFQVLEAGAAGFVPRKASPADLLTAIRTVHQGGAFLHPSATRTLLRDFASRNGGTRDRGSLDGLTEREVQVLRLLASGQGNRQVADALGIAVGTVERHRANIMCKLGLHTRTDLIKYAIRRKLIVVEMV